MVLTAGDTTSGHTTRCILSGDTWWHKSNVLTWCLESSTSTSRNSSVFSRPPKRSSCCTHTREACSGPRTVRETALPKRKLQEPLSEPLISPCTPKRRKANEEVLSRLSKAPEPLSRGKKMVQMAKQKAACTTPTKRTPPLPVSVSDNTITTRRKLFGPPATDDGQGEKVVSTANPVTMGLSTSMVCDGENENS